MRKLVSFLVVFAVIFASGCSYHTLQDALSSSEYGDYDKPEILYRNDDVGVVIFLTKNEEGDFIICRSSYEKKNSERYVLKSSSDIFIPVDISKKSEFIHLDTVWENTASPLHIIWGGIFHYPGASQVAYKVYNGKEKLLDNLVDLNKKHVFVDVIPLEEVVESYSITFDVVDKNGDVLFSYQ